MTDSDALVARLDRITYLLVALLALQAVDVFKLGPAGLVVFLVVGLFVTALLNDSTT